MVDKLAGAATAAPEVIAPPASKPNASGRDFNAALMARVGDTDTPRGHTTRREPTPDATKPTATAADPGAPPRHIAPPVATRKPHASPDHASAAKRGPRRPDSEAAS